MPVQVKGVIELRKALNAYAPDLAKELTAEITQSLQIIQSTARGFVPSPVPGNLYMWAEGSKGKKITARNSMFRTFNTEGRLRMFPLYDASVIKKGITYRTGYGKPNSRGFRSLFRIRNASAAGAIYETSGRKNPGGDPKSKSNNTTNNQFISRQGALYGSKKAGQDMRGRLIFRAWEQDQGKQTAAIFKAIDTADKRFKASTAMVDVKRSA